MNQATISISDWTQRSTSLLHKVKNVLTQVNFTVTKLPTSVFETEKPISLVFIGQFSAGKSTIIRALTGIPEIEIGEGIKTTDTHSYDWHGIEVIDTPGIHKPHAKLGEEMNAMAYSSAHDADVNILVVDASKPFGEGDQYLLDHSFRYCF